MGKTNLLVLGGGPGGYTAAFLAADLGMEVTLVDSEKKPGGVCLHRGCIPSKTLLHLAKLIHETRQAREWGLSFGAPDINLDKLRDWKNDVIEKMSGGLVNLARQRGVSLKTGRAVFLDSNSVQVSGKEILSYDKCVLAVGSIPTVPNMFKSAGSGLMDSTAALEMKDIPDRLLIVGAGYIGLEMGTIYSALGSRVTVVEMTGDLLPGVDRDIVRLLHARLKRDFKRILFNTTVSEVKKEEDFIKVVFEGESPEKEQSFDRILVAVGRQPNSEGMGLANTTVELDESGFVKVDSQFKTNDPAILSIGDVIGGPMLAHKASHEARIAVEVIAGESAKFGSRTIPAVVFTDPEIAWCGLTETEAKGFGKNISVAKFPWGASGRAQTIGRTDGVTKLILEPETGKVLGVGITGVGAGELIAEGVLAVDQGLTAKDLASSIHPHPTLSETIVEAAEVFLGKPTHIYKRPLR